MLNFYIEADVDSITKVTPKFFEVFCSPPRTPAGLALDLLQQLQDCLMLGVMAHTPTCDPQWLHSVGPGTVMIIRDADSADLPGMPQDAARLW